MSKSSQEFANSLIETLHFWCMQLLWITVVCVVKFCEDGEDVMKKERMLAGPEVTYNRRIEEIEKKVLLHLSTSTRTTQQPIHRFVNIRQFSKPPSLELFSIAEE